MSARGGEDDTDDCGGATETGAGTGAVAGAGADDLEQADASATVDMAKTNDRDA